MHGQWLIKRHGAAASDCSEICVISVQKEFSKASLSSASSFAGWTLSGTNRLSEGKDSASSDLLVGIKNAMFW
jgi:hypothetical protein